MRRKDREVAERQDIIAILERCDTLRIAINGERYPYIVPVSFGYKDEDDKLTVYFHCAREGLKLDLLYLNPYVGFEGDVFMGYEITDHGITTRYISVIGSGKCTRVDDRDEIIKAFGYITGHCGFGGYPVDRCRGIENAFVFKIEADTITGKQNLKNV